MSGCAGSCCAPICPCRFDQNPEVSSLPLVVACFQQRQAGLYAEQAYYASLPTLQNAVIDAVQALGEENGLRPSGEPEPNQTQRDAFQQKLVASVDKLASCGRFEDLHQTVADAIDDEALTETALYDTTLRIALHTGRLPERIKTHTGNRAAINALCSVPNDSDWLDMSELPTVFQQLSAAEAELSLSICTEKISGLIGTPG
jgi:hypothetical protein